MYTVIHIDEIAPENYAKCMIITLVRRAYPPYFITARIESYYMLCPYNPDQQGSTAKAELHA